MKLYSNISLYFLVILSCVSLSHSADLWLYCGSLDNYTSTELDNPLPLLSNTCFDAALESVFYAFGYTNSPEDEIVQVVIQSYITTGNFNVFLINWEEEASPGISLLYPIQYPAKAVPNALKVGKACGQAIHILSDSTLNLNKTRLKGHSLGAHLVGNCGTELQTYNKNVSRVSGWDPAGPLYEGLLALKGLTPSCAKFVEAYHTNRLFGNYESLGQLDVWFNCDDLYQPKCQNVELLKKDSCSHLAITYYMAEAILNPLAFAAAPSQSCRSWVLQGDTSAPLVYASEYTDTTARGNYYLRTNAQSPYGRGAAGAVAST